MDTCQNSEAKDTLLDDVIVNGSTWAAIWHMSWPLLIQMLSASVATFSDVWVAGKLGSETQAAVGICGQIWFFLFLLSMAISTGTTALVSRFWGARDFETARTAACQCMTFAFIFGFTSAILGEVVSGPLLTMLGTEQVVRELGQQYMQIQMLSQLPFTVLFVAHAIWRAMGNARMPMIFWAVMTATIVVANIGLCLHPFQLGIKGLAVSWLLAGSIGCALNLVCLRKTELGVCAELKSLFKQGITKGWLHRIMKIGIPACITNLAWVTGSFGLLLILSKTANPTAAQAAWAVGLRFDEIITCLPISALAVAVGTIVGQNLGAQRSGRAERAGWQVAFVSSGICVVVAVLVFFGADSISRLMSDDPEVIEYSTQYFRVVGPSLPMVAIWGVLFGAMQGAGYSKCPMWVSILVLTVVRLPLAWYLTLYVFNGPIGCWIALAISSTIIGSFAFCQFANGDWKNQKV